ncbi:MAG: MurR/RpiR family transcriptional regulator [Ruminococcaceae bacterium]|nr:MurR/RpiR family transcriptional regulator [Oscillospiraceae bacterium]
MQNDILDLIREKRDGMSKGHRLVADYLLEHFESAAYMTAQTLGTAAGVSESTVVRFAAELGLDGYPMLQQKVQDASRHRLTSVQRIKLSEMRLGDDIPGNVLTSDMEKIRYTMENLSRDSFNRAIDAIDNAGNIYITGVRSSAALAQFLYYYLDTIYDNVKFIRSSGGSEIFEQLMKIKENDVMIAISFPRYSSNIAKAAAFAASAGAKVIAITDSVSSPIARCAAEVLTARSDMASFADSLVAPLSIINAIIAAAANKRQSELSATLGRLEGVWEEYEVYGAPHRKSEDE